MDAKRHDRLVVTRDATRCLFARLLLIGHGSVLVILVAACVGVVSKPLTLLGIANTAVAWTLATEVLDMSQVVDSIAHEIRDPVHIETMSSTVVDVKRCDQFFVSADVCRAVLYAQCLLFAALVYAA